MTHTYATLEVSAEAYDEIASKLIEAGYNHAFHVNGDGATVIDMHGIGLVRGGRITRCEHNRAMSSSCVRCERYDETPTLENAIELAKACVYDPGWTDADIDRLLDELGELRAAR